MKIMRPKAKRSVAGLIEAVASEQARDGGWKSLSSSDPLDFDGARDSHVIFPTCIVLSCLSSIEESSLGDKARRDLAKMKKAGAKFLLAHRSARWSWNYLKRPRAGGKASPYPDDLDDTAGALIALAGSGTTPIGGEALAGFVESLIACEEREGGPYHTWIVPVRLRDPWRDIDVAVNASIGYLLALQGVHLPALASYIDGEARKLCDGEKPSSLYYAPIPALYFISRYLSAREDRGTESAKDLSRRLVGAIRRMARKDGSFGNALETALAIAALLNLGAPAKRVARSIRALRALPIEPAALYVEEIRAGVPCYAGSRSLTAAFALEALCAYESRLASESADASEKKEAEAFCSSVLREAQKIFSGWDRESAQSANAILDGLARKRKDKAIICLAFEWSRALGRRSKASAETLRNLALGNLFGWMGYTIQDDIQDGDSDASLLPLSNILIRASFDLLAGEAQGEEEKAYVSKVFDEIDAANLWEERHVKAKAGKELPRESAPDFGDLGVLARKSFGHALGPVIVMLRSGFSLHSEETQAVERFFFHFIVAKQLNDDAHDWEKDLEAGRINPVSALMVRDGVPREKMPLAFWERYIDEAAALIRKHIDLARRAIASVPGLSRAPFPESLLSPLERAAETALRERDKTLRFLRAYKSKDDSKS